MAKKIGVLALQGGFASHARMIEAVGGSVVYIRQPSDFAGCQGIVLPGGESTAITWLLRKQGLFAPLLQACSYLPVLATCAGLILLGREGTDARVNQMRLLDIAVKRNGYGAQVDSFTQQVSLCNGCEIPGVFIRAPKITALGEGVEVIGTVDQEPVLVQQGLVIAATFHPELTNDTTIHKRFFALCANH